MNDVNIVALLTEIAIATRKTLCLYWINWRLERYIRCAKRNKQRYLKIESVIYRYNHTFGEDLLSEPPKEGG